MLDDGFTTGSHSPCSLYFGSNGVTFNEDSSHVFGIFGCRVCSQCVIHKRQAMPSPARVVGFGYTFLCDKDFALLVGQARCNKRLGSLSMATRLLVVLRVGNQSSAQYFIALSDTWWNEYTHVLLGCYILGQESNVPLLLFNCPWKDNWETSRTARSDSLSVL